MTKPLVTDANETTHFSLFCSSRNSYSQSLAHWIGQTTQDGIRVLGTLWAAGWYPGFYTHTTNGGVLESMNSDPGLGLKELHTLQTGSNRLVPRIFSLAHTGAQSREWHMANNALGSWGGLQEWKRRPFTSGALWSLGCSWTWFRASRDQHLHLTYKTFIPVGCQNTA